MDYCLCKRGWPAWRPGCSSGLVVTKFCSGKGPTFCVCEFLALHKMTNFCFGRAFKKEQPDLKGVKDAAVRIKQKWRWQKVVRVFANDLRDQSSIPGWVIPKTEKMVLDTSLLNTQQYKVQVNGKWSNPGKGVEPSPTLRCSSFWKESLWVAFDHDCQLYLLFS